MRFSWARYSISGVMTTERSRFSFMLQVTSRARAFTNQGCPSVASHTMGIYEGKDNINR